MGLSLGAGVISGWCVSSGGYGLNWGVLGLFLGGFLMVLTEVIY